MSFGQLPHTLTVTLRSDGGELWPTYEIACPYDPDDHTTAGRPCYIYATKAPDEDGCLTYLSGCWVQQVLDADGIDSFIIENVPVGTAGPIRLIVTGWDEYPTLSYVDEIDT